ncbi:MAG TPA: TlpA disulfide reductase family protein [Bryobacteraceae bacterium]|jgi:peroxiredoxin|nr:TlpA disulfide reductase family protein [Bryobacteraceae bacterium]
MKSKADLILKGLLAVLVTALGWVIVSTIHEHVVVVGDSAPNFRITSDQGRTISPKDFGGKVLVLNFWASWCPPCVEEVPSLNRFARETASSGVVVLGVSIDKNPQLYKQFRDRFHLDFQTFRDPDENISASYGTFKIPETYIIDRNAKVVRKIISNTDWTDPEMVRFVTSL